MPDIKDGTQRKMSMNYATQELDAALHDLAQERRRANGVSVKEFPKKLTGGRKTLPPEVWSFLKRRMESAKRAKNVSVGVY
jgi:hypothetical protein